MQHKLNRIPDLLTRIISHSEYYRVIEYRIQYTLTFNHVSTYVYWWTMCRTEARAFQFVTGISLAKIGVPLRCQRLSGTLKPTGTTARLSDQPTMSTMRLACVVRQPWKIRHPFPIARYNMPKRMRTPKRPSIRKLVLTVKLDAVLFTSVIFWQFNQLSLFYLYIIFFAIYFISEIF